MLRVLESNAVKSRHSSVLLQAKIAGRTPAMPAHCSSPIPYVAHAVLAKVKYDVSFKPRQNRSHELVGGFEMLKILAAGHLSIGAPVVLEKIKAPLGKLLSVRRFMAERAFEFAACE